jgi:antitoxin PrlF
MALAKLSSKSQIVLPAEIRRRLAIKPGDMLEITDKDSRIIIRKAPLSFVDALDACTSEIWRGYDKELEEARAAWDE